MHKTQVDTREPLFYFVFNLLPFQLFHLLAVFHLLPATFRAISHENHFCSGPLQTRLCV